jgi:CO/xanthine dehydrogenase FAD-binding subunit
VLLALGAQVELQSAQESRWLPLAQMYRDDGAAHLALQPGELLARRRELRLQKAKQSRKEA